MDENVPLMVPVLESRVRPFGRGGVIDIVYGPPTIIGVIPLKVPFRTLVMLLTG